MELVLNIYYNHKEFGFVKLIDIREECLIVRKDTEEVVKCDREDLTEVNRPFMKAFLPPFHCNSYSSWVYDSKRNFCFQFITHTDVNREDREKIVSSINSGKSGGGNRYSFIKNEGIIWVNSITKLLLIRGWGHLTGTGGLNLSEKIASEIQDDLGNYLVEQLNKKK